MAFLLGLPCLTHTACGLIYSPKEAGPYEWRADVRKYVYFRKGTRWIYRSVQGADTLYDTVKVFSNRWEIKYYEDEDPEYWSIEQEWFQYKMISTVQGEIIHQSRVIPRTVQENPDQYDKFWMHRNESGQPDVVCFIQCEPGFRSLRSEYSSIKTSFDGSQSKMEIGGTVFKDVVRFLVRNPGDEKWYYWAKNVGVIKTESLVTGEKWELIDYKIKY